MQKLIRFLIIYTAIVVTLLFINTLLSIRGAVEQNKKTENAIDGLKQELSKITTYQPSSKEIVQKLDSLSSKIVDNTDKQILGTNNPVSDSPKVLSGFVTINDKKWPTADVYESNSYSSKVMAKIEFGKIYRYLKKDGSWYQISLPDLSATGWVSGRFLKEIEDTGPKQ